MITVSILAQKVKMAFKKPFVRRWVKNKAGLSRLTKEITVICVGISELYQRVRLDLLHK